MGKVGSSHHRNCILIAFDAERTFNYVILVLRWCNFGSSDRKKNEFKKIDLIQFHPVSVFGQRLEVQ